MLLVLGPDGKAAHLYALVLSQVPSIFCGMMISPGVDIIVTLLYVNTGF